MPNAITYSREQLEAMSNDELIALRQKLATAPPDNQGFSLKRGFVSGLKALPSILERKVPEETSTSTADAINEFIAKERLKQQITSEAPKTPQEQLAQMELEEINRRRGDAEVPLSNAPISSAEVSPVSPVASTITPITPITPTEAPPMFISKPKGKDKYGAMEYETVDNPEYKRWEKTQEETDKENKEKERKSQFVKDSAQETLNTIAEVEKGISRFGLFGQFPSIPGTERVTWEANINKLLSGKIIDLMTTMKEASKTGATGFGQLSNKELEVLREASTALKRYMPAADAKKILDTMKEKLNRILTGSPTAIEQEIGGLTIGSIEDGYEYTGGDPANPNSWREVK